MFNSADFDSAYRAAVAVILATGATIGVGGFLAIRWLVNHVHVAF